MASAIRRSSGRARRGSRSVPSRMSYRNANAALFSTLTPNKRTKQQTLTQIDFVSYLPQDESDTESDEDFTIPASKRQRLQDRDWEIEEKSADSHIKASRTSPSRIKTEQDPKLRIRVPKTPRNRRYAEVPSSQSPAETPASRCDSRGIDSRSPLKEKDTNSQISSHWKDQHDSPTSKQRKLKASSSMLAENESGPPSCTPIGSQHDFIQYSTQNSVKASPSSGCGTTRSESLTPGCVGIDGDSKSQISKNYRLGRSQQIEIPDSDDEGLNESETDSDCQSAAPHKDLETSANGKAGSLPVDDGIRTLNSTTESQFSCGSQKDRHHQDHMPPQSSLNSTNSQALDAQILASIHQFSVPVSGVSEETQFIATAPHSPQVEDSSVLTASPLFIGSSQNRLASSQTEDEAVRDANSPSRRRYTGGVWNTSLGRKWTDSQLLPASLMDGSLLPLPPLLSQSSTEADDDI